MLKCFSFLFLISFAWINSLSAETKPSVLKYTPEFILQEVLFLKHLSFDATKALPEIKVESQTSILDFQNAVEPQWHMRPDSFSNVYIIRQNIIYVSDEEAYYEKVQRCMDDSLAHEMTHYVQVLYQGVDLANSVDVDADAYEMDAIDVQTQFRDKYCKNLKEFGVK